MARSSSPRPYDNDCLRLPATSSPRKRGAKKKESTGLRLNRLCPPYVTPSSISSFGRRPSSAHIAESKSLKNSGENTFCQSSARKRIKPTSDPVPGKTCNFAGTITASPSCYRRGQFRGGHDEDIHDCVAGWRRSLGSGERREGRRRLHDQRIHQSRSRPASAAGLRRFRQLLSHPRRFARDRARLLRDHAARPLL